MKKLVFAAVAAIALTASVSFVSCNGNAAATDTTSVDSVNVDTNTVVNDSDSLSVDVDSARVDSLNK